MKAAPTKEVLHTAAPSHVASDSVATKCADFEFLAVSSHAVLTSASAQMISADQLFHEGKLLPLYSNQLIQSPIARKTNPADASSIFGAQPSVHKPHHPSSASHFHQSPKAPTCTSRWKELFGLKKAQEFGEDGPSACKKPADGSQDGRHVLPEQVYADSDRVGGEIEQNTAGDSLQDYLLEDLSEQFVLQTKSLSVSIADNGSKDPTIASQIWHEDKAFIASSVLSSASNKMERVKPGDNRPSRLSEYGKRLAEQPGLDSGGGSLSPRRGSREVNPGRHSVGSRPADSSRNAIATRLVVRGLERSYSSPKHSSVLRRRPETLRPTGAKHRGGTARGGLERSSSYSSAGVVRVPPVINVPVYIAPALRKGSSKSVIFNLSQLFSSRREKKEEVHGHPKQANVGGV